MFCVNTLAYWSTHHGFGKSHTSRKKGLSKSLFDLLVINSLIPFLFSYYKAQGTYKTDELIAWGAIKAESNSTIKAFSSLGLQATSAIDSQALLQLKISIAMKKSVYHSRLDMVLYKLDIFVK